LVQAVHRDQDTLRLARVPNLLTMMALIHRNRATPPNGTALLYGDITPAYLNTIDEFSQITEYTDALPDMKRWLGEVGFKMQQRRRVDQDTDQDIAIDGDTLRGWLGTAMVGTDRPAAAAHQVDATVVPAARASGGVRLVGDAVRPTPEIAELIDEPHHDHRSPPP